MTATRARTGRSQRKGGRRPDGADRFAERRHEVRKRKGARRLRWVGGLAIVAFMAVAVIGLLNSDMLAVDVVTVNGVERNQAEEVYRATNIEAGQPLIDVDNEAAAEFVEELAWVRSAVVSRSWNGTVVVDVEMRKTLFALADPTGSEFVGIDKDGIQVRRLAVDSTMNSLHPLNLEVGSESATFTLVHGLTVDIEPGELAPPSAALAINFLVSAPDDIRQLVGRMDVVGDELVLIFNSGSTARLGDSRQLGAKFQSLETVLEQVDLACLESVDVAVPSAPSVTRSCADSEEAGQDG